MGSRPPKRHKGRFGRKASGRQRSRNYWAAWEKCRSRCVYEGLARRAAAVRCPQNVPPL